MEESEFKYDVFISYSHKDEEWVRSVLLPTLEKQGLKVCIDYRDFIVGKSAIINMQDASESSRHTILVLTPKWVESEWTLYESILSRTDDPSGLQRRTIPLLLEQCKPPKFISILSWVDFTNTKRENEAWQSLFKSIVGAEESEYSRNPALQQLETAVKLYMGKLRSQVETARRDVETKSPYRALAEYDIRDIAFFFGRDSAIKELLEAVDRTSLTVLHAESGSGKTSLLKAGIRPNLFAEGHLPLYVRPRQGPIDIAIKQALLPQLQQSPIWMNASLHDFTQEICRLLDGKWLVIILDQFEEVFTLQSQTLREQFVIQLAQCLDDDLLPVRWILSLRGEWLSQLATFRPHVRKPLANDVFLESLDRQDAKAAILKPAEIKGVQYEPGLVEQLLDDLGPQLVRPPELQIVCSALYDARGQDKLISQDIHETLGGTKGILHEHFDRVLNKLPEDQKPLARQILVTLVDDDGSRISLSLNEINNRIKQQKTDTTHLVDVVAQLADNHLLRTEEIRVANQASITYELAHDYLTDKIGLDPTQQRRKIAQKLVEQKIPHYRRDGLLLSTDELALILPQEEFLSLDEEALGLLDTSKKHVRKVQFRNRIGSIASNLILVVSLIGAFILLTRILSIFAGLIIVFWVYVILFAVIGWIRGWAKEMLVSFSVILALALTVVSRHYIPIVQDLMETDPNLFWIRSIILVVLVFFGYQTVISVPHLAAKSRSETLQDTLFGGILGAMNGYLLVGTLLYWLHVADYPFESVIPKSTDPNVIEILNQIMLYMPPQLLGEPGIYFAIIVAFVFVLIVYI